MIKTSRNFLLISLYVMLAIFLIIGVFAAYIFLSEPKIPDVMEQYDYESVQHQVTLQTASLAEPSIKLDFNYAEMLAINEEFAGWLMIPNTGISLPVVQGSDNSYYLNHSFSKKYSDFGCLFFDVNSVSNADNRVIHGHNMGRNRTEMFSSLVNYQDSEYAAAHKILYFSDSAESTDTYEIFAIMNFDLNNLKDCNYLRSFFDSEQDRAAFIEYLKSNSLYESDFDPKGELLILSTCNRAFGSNNRLIVCAGKLCP